MTALRHLRVLLRLRHRVWTDAGGAQIVEFAVSLPLLVVFVVGIFDFSQAISVKQKLMNAARDAARVAASDPATDLGSSSTGVPASVSDANQVVDNYLLSEKLNDCGLSAAPPIKTAGTLTWVTTATANGCPGTGLVLSVNRGCITKIVSGITTINAVQTCVTLSYAYNWTFSRVMGVLGGNATGPSALTASATAFNEN